ncbi:MAG: lysylphosphatidylglycerol synthase domain-containing protein [Oligoflexales bacterium]
MNANWSLLKLFLSLLLWVFVGIAIYRMDFSSFTSLELAKQWPWIIGLISLLFIQNELSVIKWHRILKLQGLNLERAQVRSSFWSGLVSNLVIPSSLLGDLQKFIYLRPLLANREDVGKDLLRSQIIDRLGVYLAFTMLSILCIPAIYSLSQTQEGILKPLALFLLVLVGILLLIQILFPSLIRSCDYLQCFKNPEIIILSFMISLFVPAKIFFAAKAVGLEPDLIKVFVLSPVLLGAYLVPIGGSVFGARELVMFLLASQLNFSSSEALSVSILVGFAILISTLIGVFFFLTEFKKQSNYILKYRHSTNHAIMIIITMGTALGLHPIFMGAFSFCYLALIMRKEDKDDVINPANFITSLRLLLIPIFLVPNIDGYSKGLLLVLLLGLDGFDGFIARKLSCTSRFGARFDMEVDAMSVLFASTSLVIHHSYPVWVICMGTWRYLFAFWRETLFPSFNAERRSNLGRMIFAMSISSLCLAFLFTNNISVFLLFCSVFVLTASFMQDVLFTIEKAKNER